MENFRLKVFETVARHLNFRRAAEELHLTQPAVTLQIKALEEELGVPLFDRSGVRVALTPAGRVLLRYARRIAKLVAEAQSRLSQFGGEPRGELRLGASLTIAQYILPRILGPFHREFPQVKLSVMTRNTEQVLEALAAHDILLGLVEGPTMRRDVRTEVFLEDEIVLIAGPDYAKRGLEAAALREERLLTREQGSGTRRVVEAALQAAGVNVRQLDLAMEFDSTEGIIAAVESGAGLAFTSIWSIGKELQVGSLITVPIRGVRITRPLRVAFPAGPEPAGNARAFLDFLRLRRELTAPGALISGAHRT